MLAIWAELQIIQVVALNVAQIQSHFQYELPKSLNCAGFFFMHGNQFLMGSERFMLSILDFSFQTVSHNCHLLS